MHPEIAACCRLLARLNYIMGDYGEAMSYEQRAVLMSERVLGIDHPNTITEYVSFCEFHTIFYVQVSLGSVNFKCVKRQRCLYYSLALIK